MNLVTVTDGDEFRWQRVEDSVIVEESSDTYPTRSRAKRAGITAIVRNSGE